MVFLTEVKNLNSTGARASAGAGAADIFPRKLNPQQNDFISLLQTSVS